ncbi:transporter [Nakamurella antarctica]|uniref:Transporter n=1 Tax=Nakamurella antarctica TaxID=1902245 RepID=A0A3G8ZJD2_9ACTN|nr:transporter [Nakamurella antarctica]AZI57469.1 transporter [Nakamurella antarctica]
MDWPRLWWTLGLAVLCVVIAGLLLLGWRNRGKRQTEFGPRPVAPREAGEPLSPDLTGVYISTTYTSRWQDRVVVQTVGRRAKAAVRVSPLGILIDRIGEDALWIPAADVVAISAGPGVAGKVMGMPDAILLITWNWGDTPVDSGIRTDDLFAQRGWIEAARTLVTSHSSSTTTTDSTPESNGATA